MKGQARLDYFKYGEEDLADRRELNSLEEKLARQKAAKKMQQQAERKKAEENNLREVEEGIQKAEKQQEGNFAWKAKQKVNIKAAKAKKRDEEKANKAQQENEARARQAEEEAKKIAAQEEERQQQLERDEQFNRALERNQAAHASLDETFERILGRLRDIGDAYREEMQLPEKIRKMFKEDGSDKREEQQEESLKIIKSLTKLSEALQERGSIELINGVSVLDIIATINRVIDETHFDRVDNSEIITLLQDLRGTAGIDNIVNNALATFGVEEDYVMNNIAPLLEGYNRELGLIELNRMVDELGGVREDDEEEQQAEASIDEEAARQIGAELEDRETDVEQEVTLTSETGALIIRFPQTLIEYIAAGGRLTFADGITLPNYIVEPVIDLTLAPGGGVLTVYRRPEDRMLEDYENDQSEYVITDANEMQQQAVEQLNTQASGGGGYMGMISWLWGGGAS